MENNGDNESEESWLLWFEENCIPQTLQISETICQPLIPIQSNEQTLLTTGESLPLPSPEQFARETHHQISPISEPLTSIQGGDEEILLMAGESQPPQGKPAKRKKIVCRSEEERLTRKRATDQKYRQKIKRKQEEVKNEKERLELANKKLELEIGQLNCKIQEREQEIEQLKKENQEREQQWESDLKKCAAGFGQLKHEIREKEQILKSMQDKETRWKSMLDTMETEANDKLLKSRSCSCSRGQQCKTGAIETEDLQIKSEMAQIRNERDNLKEQETVFKKILTGMDAKIGFYYYERKEAGWISFGKNVLEATVTLFCARGGTLLAAKAH